MSTALSFCGNALSLVYVVHCLWIAGGTCFDGAAWKGLDFGFSESSLCARSE